MQFLVVPEEVPEQFPNDRVFIEVEENLKRDKRRRLGYKTANDIHDALDSVPRQVVQMHFLEYNYLPYDRDIPKRQRFDRRQHYKPHLAPSGTRRR